jgi:hypothetical protein
MGYEVFKRTGVRVESPALTIVPDGRIAINAASSRILMEAGVKAVILLWDESTHRIALKAASKGTRDAYAVSLAPDCHSGSVRAKAFIAYIGWNAPQRQTMPATWSQSDKMLEAMLPPAFLEPRSNVGGKRRTKTGP